MNIYKNEKLLEAFDEYVRMKNDLLPCEETLSVITFSEEFRERMRRLLSRQQWGFYVLFGTVGRRIASFLVAALIATTVTTISVEALRKPVAEFFAEVFERFTQIFFVDETPDSPEVEMGKRVPAYIPDGYKMEKETDLPTVYRVVYVNEIGEKIRYAQQDRVSIEAIIDTEDITYTDIQIGIYQGLIYENKGISTIVFSDDQYTYTLSGISLDILLKIAQSISGEI